MLLKITGGISLISAIVSFTTMFQKIYPIIITWSVEVNTQQMIPLVHRKKCHFKVVNLQSWDITMMCVCMMVLVKILCFWHFFPMVLKNPLAHMNVVIWYICSHIITQPNNSSNLRLGTKYNILSAVAKNLIYPTI